MDKPQIITHLEKSMNHTLYDVVWIPSSAKFVTLGSSTRARGTLHIFELGSEALEPIKSVEKPQGLKCGTFAGSSLADRHLATGDHEGSLQTWDLEHLSKPVYSVRAHQKMVNALDGVGGAGRQQGAPELVTGSNDGSVKVWDVRQETPVAVMEPAEGEPRRDCWTVAFGNSYSATERCVCAGYDNGDIKLFDLRAMKVRWETNVKNGVCSVQFDRRDIEMNKIAATTLESGVHVFDARTQHPERGLACLTERAHKSTVWRVRHLPQNRDIFMTTGGSGSLNLWHYTYPGKRRERDAGGDFGVMGTLTQLQNGIVSSQPVCAFDWSPDKRGLCACVAFDQTVRVIIVTKLQLFN
ncbi:WD repeat-containing protein 92-like [Pollicipes pollicipes]|uniref:WD repeat-containing protein 92-like n=1 Tax=Pollicipes pollicipes TaxID=41117 RepID=UPI0018855F99|nr:WD repeat-containing protein 92-like [Pollicipes pollicipes]XP_037070482.1 WD repeat-containing protein 92-like [Pollicipes pollicipes]